MMCFGVYIFYFPTKKKKTLPQKPNRFNETTWTWLCARVWLNTKSIVWANTCGVRQSKWKSHENHYNCTGCKRFAASISGKTILQSDGWRDCCTISNVTGLHKFSILNSHKKEKKRKIAKWNTNNCKSKMLR